MYFVYVLYNKTSNKIYIGQTANIQKRLFEHNKKQGNHFTARIPGKWELKLKEEYVDRTSAIRREKQLKSYQGRLYIKQLVES